MKQIPKISEAEWTVMKILWAKAPRNANEVIDALKGKVRWNPRTVKTLLGRLVKKKALGVAHEGRTYLYFPRVDEVDCVRAESRSFLGKVTGGALMPMLVHLLEDDALTPEEIADLRKLLDKKDREKRSPDRNPREVQPTI